MGTNTQEPVKEAEPEIVMVPIYVSAPPEDQLPDASPSEKMSQTNDVKHYRDG
jgi:hypothetical protein